MKPNIIHFITHDTGRYLGCYGADVKTPNINKLAEKSTLFTNYFCSAPQCSPSRASMFSGLVPHRNGMIGLAHRGFRLKDNIPYLPKILAQNGYKTILFCVQHETKWGNHHELGYQQYFTGNTSSCTEIGKILCDFLHNPIDEPFFISVGVSETHQRYPIVENPDPKLKVPEFLPDHMEVKKDIAGLNILVERVDETIGKIVSTLEETHRIDNTLFIFTTDHGIAMPGAKATLFDPGIEIFLIMKGPKIPEGKRVDCLAWNVDLMPTVLDYLGLEIPENIDGKSLMGVLNGHVKEIHQQIYPELTFHAGYDPTRSIRTKKFKYIRSFEVRPFYYPVNVDNSFTKELFRSMGYFDTIRPFEFFFDLDKDPLEKHNLINDPGYRQIVEQFRNDLIRWMKETDDPLLYGPVNVPEGCRVSVPWGYNPEDVWDNLQKID
ncbi:MAG: sulfatase [Candidatus Omnitrophica bacterium]|nr:sulfatase [Candidatus Omnitrophota bacterium]